MSRRIGEPPAKKLFEDWYRENNPSNGYTDRTLMFDSSFESANLGKVCKV